MLKKAVSLCMAFTLSVGLLTAAYAEKTPVDESIETFGMTGTYNNNTVNNRGVTGAYDTTGATGNYGTMPNNQMYGTTYGLGTTGTTRYGEGAYATNFGVPYNSSYGTNYGLGTTGTTHYGTYGSTGANYGMNYGTTEMTGAYNSIPYNPTYGTAGITGTTRTTTGATGINGTTTGIAGTIATHTPTATGVRRTTATHSPTATGTRSTNPTHSPAVTGIRSTTRTSTATSAPNAVTRDMTRNDVSAVPISSDASTGFGYDVAADVANTKYAEAAELLKVLSIMVGDAETGNFRPNDNIIRSEVAKVGVYMLGLSEVAANSTNASRFPDVPSTHWATGAINVSDTQKIVIGDETGHFRPDDNITFAEAVTIVMRALGFEPAAQANGGFPTGYMVTAANNGVLRGVTGSADVPATRGDVAQLVYNALTTDIMEQTGYGANVTYEIVPKTLLTERLDVEKKRGQITANYETRLTGTSGLKIDEVDISGETQPIKVGTTKARNLLGYNVVYYVRTDKVTDEKILVLARPETTKNDVLTVSSTNISGVTGTAGATGAIGEKLTFSYWINKETDRDPRRATIAANAKFIYNGMAETLTNIADLQPDSGNVVLLDTTMSGEYDLIFINRFNNVVVEDISLTTGRVTDKYIASTVVLDPMDTTIKHAIIRNGLNIALEDLKEWDVLSVTESKDGTLIKVYVSNASVSGTVTELLTNEKYIIDGVEYEKAKNLIDAGEEIKLQDKGIFYLDIEGKIAAFDTTAMITENYAYVVDAGEGGTFEAVAQFKVFDKTGATIIYNGATKMRINDDYLTAAEVLADARLFAGSPKKAINQVITYELNSRGEISSINTAYNNTTAKTPMRDRFTLNDTGTFTYKSASGRLTTATGTGGGTVNASTIVFDVPATADNDTTFFSVRNASMFANDTDYTGSIYDLTEEYVARCVVVTSSTGAAAPESAIAVVDRITETQNADLTYVDKLYAFQGGQRVEVLARDRGILIKPVTATTPTASPAASPAASPEASPEASPAASPEAEESPTRGFTRAAGTKSLEQGDVIQYRTNARGEIDHITILFNIDDKTTEFMEVDTIATDLTTAYGKVTRKFAGSVNMSINTAIHNFATTGATVYEVDTTKSTNQVRVIDPADLQIFEANTPTSTGNERRVFVKIYKDVPQEFVMIR